MPTTIPYDPSLVLGNLVDQNALTNLLEISKEQAKIDAAQEKLNSFIAMKRSVDMTIQELINMEIDPTELIVKSTQVGQNITQAATEYASIRIQQEELIQQLRAKIQVVHSEMESPVDYNRTVIKKMPLAADSLKLDAQYFAFEENEQSAQNTVSKIQSYVSAQTSFLGTKNSMQAGTTAASQVNSQRQNHSVSGTLVITANCTHKDAVMLAPFILDVDKAIRAWNRIFKDNKDKIKINDVISMQQIAAEEGTDAEKFISLVSGATYGSSFVGMVHVLKSESTETSQTMTSLAANLQDQFDTGSWFTQQSGGFGVDSSFANDIKNLLSTQRISSHVTLITMGSIPSIKSNKVTMAVKQFANFDPAAMMTNLANFANNTSDQKSVASSAEAARTGGQMVALQNAQITSVLTGLADTEKTENQMLDINSMMTAFEDYVNKAIAGNIGVPINYYLKSITRAQLAEMWVAKYYPNRYLSISGDDSKQAGAASSGTSNSQQAAS